MAQEETVQEQEGVDLEKLLSDIAQEAGEVDEGDAAEDGTGADTIPPSPEEISEARRIACEECLHTLANYALELEAGKRESITAEDIRVAFASHEVEEIYDEAKIFFMGDAEDSDLDEEDAGEEDPPGDGDDEDDEEDFEGDELAEE